MLRPPPLSRTPVFHLCLVMSSCFKYANVFSYGMPDVVCNSKVCWSSCHMTVSHWKGWHAALFILCYWSCRHWFIPWKHAYQREGNDNVLDPSSRSQRAVFDPFVFLPSYGTAHERGSLALTPCAETSSPLKMRCDDWVSQSLRLQFSTVLIVAWLGAHVPWQ